MHQRCLRHDKGHVNGQHDRDRHCDQFSRRDQLRVDLLRKLCQRHIRHADGHGGNQLLFYRLERRLLRDRQLRRHDGRDEIGHSDFYGSEFRAYAGESGHGQRHRFQLALGNQLRIYLLL